MEPLYYLASSIHTKCGEDVATIAHTIYLHTLLAENNIILRSQTKLYKVSSTIKMSIYSEYAAIRVVLFGEQK